MRKALVVVALSLTAQAIDLILVTGQIVFEGRSGTPEPVPAWRDALAKYAK